jgi:hypothetical protein
MATAADDSVSLVTDPLLPLLDLADVADALEAARAAADAAMRHPALRRSGGRIAAEVGLRDAVASAALADHAFDREDVRNGLVTDPVVQGALRVTAALDGLTAQWVRAPRQILARLHVLAAHGMVPDDELGRPVADPLIGARLDALAAIVAGSPVDRGTAGGGPVAGSAVGRATVGGRTTAPTLLVAAVVHGELLALDAFAGPSGVVARGAGRLALIAGGLDPRGLLAIDVGHLERRPEYQGAAGAFATGTPDGVRSWLKHYAAAVVRAAEEIVVVAA